MTIGQGEGHVTLPVCFPQCISVFFRTINADDLTHLHSLLLGGLHSDRILEDLVAVVGHQLTTLKIETVVTEVPLQVGW